MSAAAPRPAWTGLARIGWALLGWTLHGAATPVLGLGRAISRGSAACLARAHGRLPRRESR